MYREALYLDRIFVQVLPRIPPVLGGEREPGERGGKSGPADRALESSETAYWFHGSTVPYAD